MTWKKCGEEYKGEENATSNATYRSCKLALFTLNVILMTAFLIH